MPELPEVEIVRRGLAPILTGRRIERAVTRRADLRYPFPERFAERLQGQTIDRLDRRAKYLIASLSGGDALVMHLGMTGRFSIIQGNVAEIPGSYIYETSSNTKHDHVEFQLSGDARIVYNDPRRFGFMVLVPEQELTCHELFKKMGVEPLGSGLTPDYLAACAKSRKVNLKSFLMDQRHVAGLGNIYVSEALHRAGLSPDRAARFLSDRQGRPTARAQALVPAIQSVLEQALAAGGSTLRDYRHADGQSGAFQESFAVYDRAGQPCVKPGCKGTIYQHVHSGRATYACSACQK